MSEKRLDAKNRWRNVVVAFRMSPEMVKHFCNTNTEKISLYYEYLFSNGVRYPFDECGRI